MSVQSSGICSEVNKMLLGSFTLICLYFTTAHCAVEDIYNQIPNGFLPSPVKYFQQNGDQIAEESVAAPATHTNDNSLTASSDPQPRIGYPLYAGSTMGSATGMYTPVKLDLGGLLLGTVVGLGAVLILPKLLHAFSYNSHSYGHYGRNEEGNTSGLTEIMSRVDEALAAQHINSSACLQRALCSSIQSSPSSLTSTLTGVTRNPLVSFLLEGSRMEQAVEMGLSGHDCATIFAQCPINQETVSAGIKAISSSLEA